jgi:ABC-type antimicrobial peptide transport system permease subunit
MYSNLFANFATRDQLRDFVNLGCKGGECSSGKKPQIVAFGNLTLALEGIMRSIAKFLLLGMAVIMIVAAVMIMFTISKVISDSSKEIAVFRSLGARRRDIAQIYYTYGLMLAASALILSCVLAAIGATVVSHIYDTSIADGLIQTTGAYTRDVHVQLLAFNPLWFGAVTVALAVAALIGITVPVLANLRRKLITILREE